MTRFAEVREARSRRRRSRRRRTGPRRSRRPRSARRSGRGPRPSSSTASAVQPEASVGDDLHLREADVDPRLEDLHATPRDLRAGQPPDQLLGLSGEHRSADHLDRAERAGVHDGTPPRRAEIPSGRTSRSEASGPSRRSRPWRISAWLIKTHLSRGKRAFRSRSTFSGSVMPGPAESAREPADMRVDDDAVRRAENVSEDDVRGLPPDAGQGAESVHRSREPRRRASRRSLSRPLGWPSPWR